MEVQAQAQFEELFDAEILRSGRMLVWAVERQAGD